MKNILFVFAFLLFTHNLQAAPLKTEFDWTKFYGFYKYVSCDISHNKPIWAEDLKNTKIEISNYSGLDPYKIDLTRWPDNASYILLGMTLERINQGKYVEYDEDTQKVSRELITYTTKDGVYGYLRWNFKDINVGWSSLQLQMLENKNIRYTMKLRYSDDDFTAKEVCELKAIK